MGYFYTDNLYIYFFSPLLVFLSFHVIWNAVFYFRLEQFDCYLCPVRWSVSKRLWIKSLIWAVVQKWDWNLCAKFQIRSFLWNEVWGAIIYCKLGNISCFMTRRVENIIILHWDFKLVFLVCRGSGYSILCDKGG